MVYTSKIITTFLLPPGAFILLMAILTCYLLCKRKTCKSAWRHTAMLTILVYVFSISLVARALLQPLERMHQQTPLSASADVVVVLGGGAVAGAPDLDGTGSLLGYSANRLLTGVRLSKVKNLPLLFSGGQVYADDANEALVSKRIADQLSIGTRKILVEPRARNTAENAYRSLAICREQGYKRVLLVTSAYHMPRAMYQFTRAARKSDVQLLPYPCDYQLSWRETAKVDYRDFLPREDAWELNYLALHEWLGLLAARIL